MIPRPYHGIDLISLPDTSSTNSTQPAMIPIPYHGIDLKTLPDLQLYKLNPASHDSQTISWHRSKNSTRPAALQTQPSQP
ncbi:hypothetical protein DPMN_109478 [Dreissena polymorpha]|nr:hypothetical protein DPMN_109478 [Dreissena polymorpha]